MSRRLTIDEYADGVLHGDRVVLARAITLVESDLAADVDAAATLLDRILRHTGRARRVGITGVPGVGKSSFIDTLGMHLVRDRGERVAVLTVDPSSPVSGGSILGDKTRMERLALEPDAFIRPSPSRGHLGGVARRTRETMLLCEAAGFGNILVETVGVGQSETAVRAMTDFFLLLMLAGAGDELQGIKRGIIEMVDGMAITKADGDNVARAAGARAEYAAALHLLPASEDGWAPRVVTCSARSGTGVGELWEVILEHEQQLAARGLLAQRRSAQAVEWMRELIRLGLEDRFARDPLVASALPMLESAVREGRLSAFGAARRALIGFAQSSETSPTDRGDSA
jgi:LAO/AO transport system kinase